MDWDRIKHEYETSDITLKALADKYGIKDSTIRSRKNREKWQRNGATQRKKATQRENVATHKAIQPVIENEDLTEKQRLFCLYYVKSFNATQSAIKAGYSPDTAHVQGPRLLGNVRVGEEIKRIKGAMATELYVDAMDVLQKWVKIAFTDITDYLTFGQKEVPVIGMMGPMKDEEDNPITKIVNYVDFKESHEIDGTLISEVKQGKDGVAIKLADKMKALEKLSQYFDLFPDKFKRQIEEEKIKLEHHKIFGSEDQTEYEDDGFEDALNAVTSEVWDEDTGESDS